MKEQRKDRRERKREREGEEEEGRGWEGEGERFKADLSFFSLLGWEWGRGLFLLGDYRGCMRVVLTV